jgi:transposase
VTRLSASRQAVRCAGLDVGGAPLRPPLADRQADPPRLAAAALALYESAQAACRPTAPSGLALKARGLSHTRASVTIARKLARRCFHTLRKRGPDALQPVA